MYILLSTEKMKNQLVYEQYKINNLPEQYTVLELNENTKFEDVFRIIEEQKTYIQYNKPETNINFQSVQYWYYDREENGGDGYLHFVFGLNVDNSVSEKKIYISTLKNRNNKV